MRVAFLDRDGVLNVDYGYVHKIKDFCWVPGAIEGMQILTKLGYKLIIVTNQAGIARGFYGVSEFNYVMSFVEETLKKHNINLLDVFFCPHHIEGVVKEYSIECLCRKPKPGMILQATSKYGIDLDQSVLIGDMEHDIEAGEISGVGRNFLVDSCDEKSKQDFFNSNEKITLLKVSKSLQKC